MENTTYFSTKVEKPRNNDQFRSYSDESHDLVQILCLNLVKGLPYEYMHVVCLGVTKKLILLWIRGDRHI